MTVILRYSIIKCKAIRCRVEYIMFQFVLFISESIFMCNFINHRKSNRQYQKINVMNLSRARIGIRYEFVKISKKFGLDVIIKTMSIRYDIVEERNKWCHVRGGRLGRFLYSSCRNQRVDILHRCRNFYPNDSLKIIMYLFFYERILVDEKSRKHNIQTIFVHLTLTDLYINQSCDSYYLWFVEFEEYV